MPSTSKDATVRWGKPLIFLLCLGPFLVLLWDLYAQALGPNPVEAVVHFTGIWTLRLLLATLAITPLRRLTGRQWLLKFRRMLGLFAFFYASLHFTAYLVLDRALVWGEILRDLTDRPYIMVGFAALIIMAPLAMTSTRGWIRRLGRRWRQLHRLVYVIAILGVLHFLWLVKADLREPLVYGGLFALLLVARLPLGEIARRQGTRTSHPLSERS